MNRRVLALLGLAAASALVALLLLRDRTPRLTRADLEEARKRWQASGIRDYELDLLVELDRQAPRRYRLEVRKDAVARFEQGGREDPQTSNGTPWTVPGLFEVIDQELALAAGPPVDGAPLWAVLKGRFDPRLGYPLVFKRLASRGQSMFIHVERFSPGG